MAEDDSWKDINRAGWTSLAEAVGKSGDDRPADRPRWVETLKMNERELRLRALITTQVDEGQRLQRVERKAPRSLHSPRRWTPSAAFGFIICNSALMA